MSDRIMSFQARRRLLDSMRPEELRDLAMEIANAIEEVQGAPVGGAALDAIEHILTHP